MQHAWALNPLKWSKSLSDSWTKIWSFQTFRACKPSSQLNSLTRCAISSRWAATPSESSPMASWSVSISPISRKLLKVPISYFINQLFFVDWKKQVSLMVLSFVSWAGVLQPSSRKKLILSTTTKLRLRASRQTWSHRDLVLFAPCILKVWRRLRFLRGRSRKNWIISKWRWEAKSRK